jgi:hypothetical protein
MRDFLHLHESEITMAYDTDELVAVPCNVAQQELQKRNFEEGFRIKRTDEVCEGLILRRLCYCPPHSYHSGI